MSDAPHEVQPEGAVSDAPQATHEERRTLPGWVWAAVGPLAALAAFHASLSNTEMLYVRDLSVQFWGEHVWLRRELLSGHLPLWDPYYAFGQPAIADPNRGLLFPPTLLIRVLFPVVLGFNLAVALAFPFLALGMYLFLRRHVSRPAAAFGSAALVLSGPAISMGNFLNFPWAFAFVPWALYAADLIAERVTPRRFAGLAVAFAMLFLAGEAVTLLTGAALAVLYSAAAASTDRPARARLLAALVVVAAGLVAVLLAAAQAAPMAETIGRSLRAFDTNQLLVRFWSLHPVTLVETVVPQAFGFPLSPFGASGIWARALNGGREPFLLSVYLGLGVIGLGLLGALVSRPRRVVLFWAGVALALVIAALGDHLPIYPAVQRAVPVLESVRYPSKYMVFVALAVTVLATLGWEALATGLARDARRAARFVVGALVAVGVAFLALTLWASAASGSLEAAALPLISVLKITEPSEAAPFLVESMMLVGPRVFAIAFGAAACVWFAATTPNPRPRWLLFGLVVVDLFFATAGLLPTVDASLMDEPEWVRVVHEHPADRVYIAGRLSASGQLGTAVDLPFAEKGLAVSGRAAAADIAVSYGFMASFPSAWRVRDPFSFDNSLLFPREQWGVMRRFAQSPLDGRVRFLSRVGVRYYLVPWDGVEGGSVRSTFPNYDPLRLHERPPTAGRLLVVPAAHVEPDTAVLSDRLFSEEFDPTREVLLAAPSTSPHGAASEPCAPAAEFVVDGSSEVVVRACVPDGGAYLVLLDSFDPNWSAEVDGEPAPVLRANAIFRAVHLASGDHTVRFAYRPRRFWLGASVSAVTALGLVGACLIRRRRRAE